MGHVGGAAKATLDVHTLWPPHQSHHLIRMGIEEEVWREPIYIQPFDDSRVPFLLLEIFINLKEKMRNRTDLPMRNPIVNRSSGKSFSSSDENFKCYFCLETRNRTTAERQKRRHRKLLSLCIYISPSLTWGPGRFKWRTHTCAWWHVCGVHGGLWEEDGRRETLLIWLQSPDNIYTQSFVWTRRIDSIELK